LNRVLEIPEESADELAVFLREHGVKDSYGDPLGIVLARLESRAMSSAVRALQEIVRAPQRAVATAQGALEALGLEQGPESDVRKRSPYDSY
jgi:hypothetical protein